MNLWTTLKVQAALALFVAAAFTQLAHAGGPKEHAKIDRPAASFYSPQALKAMGDRWTAMAAFYQHKPTATRVIDRPAASFYSPQALKAMGDRWTAMATFYLGKQAKPAQVFEDWNTLAQY